MFEEEEEQEIGQRELCCSCYIPLHELLPLVYQWPRHSHDYSISLLMARKEHDNIKSPFPIHPLMAKPDTGGAGAWGATARIYLFYISMVGTRTKSRHVERTSGFVAKRRG